MEATFIKNQSLKRFPELEQKLKGNLLVLRVSRFLYTYTFTRPSNFRKSPFTGVTQKATLDLLQTKTQRC